MDLDRHEESDFEPSEEDDSLSEAPHRERLTPARHHFEPDLIEEASPTGDGKPSSKWERQQGHYSDRYVELFQAFAGGKPDYFEVSGYETSQIGAITWEPDEKVKFFEALPGVGRHNLPVLAQRVGTKSQLEIKSYLDQLRSAEADRQLFEKQTKNVSKADIPAAIEIGPDLEAHLQQAADALAAFQEQYDHAFGQQEYKLPFIINHAVASRLDAKTEVSLNANGQFEDAFESSESAPHELFHLATFIDLSRDFFMHGSQWDLNGHWQAFAEDDESPAITQQVVSDIYELVISLLRRLVQTALFLAQSRLRASSTQQRAPNRAVSKEDVQAASRILKSESDLWDYWTELPRRFGFKVVSGSRRKGDSVRKALSYDEVEAILAVRRHAGRRRSLSVTSGTSTESSVESDEASSLGDNVEVSSEDTGVEDMVEERASQSTHEQSQTGADSGNEELSAQKPTAPSRIPPNKRKRLLEEELDEHLETMDQQARQEEEAHLRSLLGVNESDIIKQEPIEVGRRPKMPRKSVEEVATWAPVYQAEWESHPKSLLGDMHAITAGTEDDQQREG